MKKIEWYHSLIVFFLFFALVNIIGSIAMLAYSELVLGQPFTMALQFQLDGIIIGSSTMLVFMFLTPYFYLKLLKVDPKKFFDFAKPKAMDLLWATLGVIAVSNVISYSVGSLVEIYPFLNDGIFPMGIDFHEEIAKHFRTGGFITVTTMLLVMAVFPGFGEEYIFRGFMQKILNQKYNLFISILLSGGLFASVHLIQQISQAMGAFLISFFLGYIYYASKNLVLPMVGHMVNNSLFGITIVLFPEMSTTELPSMLVLILSIIVGSYSIWHFKTQKLALGN